MTFRTTPYLHFYFYGLLFSLALATMTHNTAFAQVLSSNSKEGPDRTLHEVELVAGNDNIVVIDVQFNDVFFELTVNGEEHVIDFVNPLKTQRLLFFSENDHEDRFTILGEDGDVEIQVICYYGDNFVNNLTDNVMLIETGSGDDTILCGDGDDSISA